MRRRTDSWLEARMRFIRTIDRLKRVERRTYLMDGSRHENSAEHSWHLAMMATVLSPYSARRIDPGRCIRMALVHDIPEIIAGDVIVYDTRRRQARRKTERAAARRIFGMLPRGQAKELLGLWREVEDGASPEARFVRALDRLEPILCNYATRGRAWRAHGVRAAEVLALNLPRLRATPRLAELVTGLIETAIRRRMLRP